MKIYTIKCIDQFDRLFQWQYIVDGRYRTDGDFIMDYMFRRGVGDLLREVGAAAWARWWSEEREWKNDFYDEDRTGTPLLGN